jgi:two-component system, NtrC family, nitrogen regulation sensor histidine kinase NtrY
VNARHARPRAALETRSLRLALLAGVVASLAIGAAYGMSAKALVTLAVAVVGVWLGAALSLRGQVERTLQTLANLVGALRGGD